ncbi:hypothetical protein SAMD00019534_066600, partial [Acytostelium subglobosum LB1]|uniref:hypothetical protein n=1 Tax=Acytostelium subglobosum LB1 TaxID=1410327 RepID=UPI000644AADB
RPRSMSSGSGSGPRTSPNSNLKRSRLRGRKPKKDKPLRKKKKKYIGETRNIFVNDQTRNLESKFGNNTIKTTKYTLLNFIPKNLYEQFRRAANFFFLIILIIQVIPLHISAVNPYATIIPLIFVLAVTAVKEAIEDIKRRKHDITINNLPVRVFNGAVFEERPWKNLKVGDIVKVCKGESFPADLIVLNTSEQHGVCYIETSNLDGETNLKMRQAIPETFENLRNEADLALFRGRIECEHPNNVIYVFRGALAMTSEPSVVTYPLSNQQTLLRGCILRNADWVYGVSVYTGGRHQGHAELHRCTKQEKHPREAGEPRTHQSVPHHDCRVVDRHDCEHGEDPPTHR